MVFSYSSVTKILTEIPPAADISSISISSGAVANIFDSSGKLVIKPCEIAEKAHPQEIWFKLDISSNHFVEGLKQMDKLSHMGFSNFGILIAGAKDAADLYRVRLIAEECGFSFGLEIPFGVMVEYPAMALSYSAISKAGASFAVIDVDGISKKIMCSEKTYETIPEPVLRVLNDSIKHFKDMKIHVAASGKMLDSAYVLKELVGRGVDSLISSSDNLEKLRIKACYAEKMQEIDFMKSKIRMHMKSRVI